MQLSFFQSFRTWLQAPSRTRWKHLLAGILLLFLALLAATWVISWQRLESEREMVDRNSRVRQESLASIIAENLAQVLERGRLLALASAEWFEGNRKDATNRLQSGQSHAQSWPSAEYLAKK